MRRPAPISRGVLSNQVKDRLLKAILAGDYAPGSRIVETWVARELGVSQAPVREALRDLEALGVVEIHPFRGARVRRPSKAELLEAYGIRAELESFGARLAMSRLTAADLEELQHFVDEMQRAASAGDPHAEALVDFAFHARVVKGAGNRTLERVWRYLEPVGRTYITLVAPGVDGHEIAGLHQPILDALVRRDPEAASEAVRRHFDVVSGIFDARFVETPVATGRAAAAAARADRGAA